jgi:hypothetical protein
MLFKRIVAPVFILGLLSVMTAEAALLSYSNRALFESTGAIQENYGFEDIGQYSESRGVSWNTHGVTYTSDENYIFTGSLGSKPPVVSNVLINNYWLSLTGSLDVGTNHNMLGFDLAVLFPTATPGNITLSIYTNQATYIYDDLSLPDISYDQEFFGFVSGEGELFTGFNLTSDAWGTAAALDNVTLGTTAVPLPSALFLFGSGLFSLISISLTKR